MLKPVEILNGADLLIRDQPGISTTDGHIDKSAKLLVAEPDRLVVVDQQRLGEGALRLLAASCARQDIHGAAEPRQLGGTEWR